MQENEKRMLCNNFERKPGVMEYSPFSLQPFRAMKKPWCRASHFRRLTRTFGTRQRGEGTQAQRFSPDSRFHSLLLTPLPPLFCLLPSSPPLLLSLCLSIILISFPLLLRHSLVISYPFSTDCPAPTLLRQCIYKLM